MIDPLSDSRIDSISHPSLVRASDAEREHAIVRLHDACGAGRLNLEEFSERVNLVLAARTRGELARATADLPIQPGLVEAAPRPAKRVTLSILSGVKRRGRWLVDRKTHAISVMGSCTLDLRDAILDGQEIDIVTWVVMGSVKVIVSPGSAVELEGFALMGSRDCKVDDHPDTARGPVVRIRGLTIMGSVEVVAE